MPNFTFGILKCFPTTAPGVEQYIDVVGWIVRGDELAACATGFHYELISANHGRGRRVHGQLESVAALFHHGGLPAIILQVLHQGDDDMGSL